MNVKSRRAVKIAAILAATAVAGGIVGRAAHAAEDAGPNGIPAGTVLDHNTLWRQFQVSRPSYVRTDDGALEPRDITWYWGGIRSQAADTTDVSPLPPADWTDPAFDDHLWPRVRLPQPVLTVSGANPRPFYVPYATGMVMVRGTFEVKQPAQVRSCTLSLEYWGGAVVYLNGKEVARGHAPDGKTPPAGGQAGPEAVAQDYPIEAFTTPDGKPLRVGDGQNQDRLALRDRRLADVQIPTSLLRQGTNVLAIEVRQAPVPEVIARGVGQNLSSCGWPPIGLLDASLTVSPASAATPNLQRPAGFQVWNCAPCDTLTAYDYGNPLDALRPIVVHAARNGVFSGRLAVGSDQPIKGLMVSLTDLALPEGEGTIAKSAVRIRYAEPAVAGKSWAPPYRFDGLVDAIPAEIPLVNAPPARDSFFGRAVDRQDLTAGAVASLWLTVRVPKDARPGTYQGTVTVAAEGLAPTAVPFRLEVSDWTVPDPKDFRVHNFAYLSDDAVARHYDVPLWSDRHFELMGRSLALMAEVNSRQVFVNLAVDFYGLDSNRESVVRWIRQPDGTYRHDFSVFDRFLDMVAKAVGTPLPLRLNCWGELGRDGANASAKMVSVLDPATATVERLAQPTFGTDESYAFWKPVIDEILKKVEARGWLDATSLGHNSYCWAPKPQVVDVAKRLWPDGVWSYTAHNGKLGSSFTGTEKDVSMPVRFADTVWGPGRLTARGYRALLKPLPGYSCFTYRGCFHDNSPLTDLRRIDEDEIMMGHDGISDFGADLFPYRDASGRYRCVGNGRGTGGPGNSTRAVLAPGPDGAIATERFEMLREGAELCEAILFIQRAIEGKKISDDLEARANRYLDERGEAFRRGWFGVRYIQAEHDENLLGLAGEVARTIK